MTKKISDVHIKRFVAILLAVFFGISAFASTRPVTNPDTLTFRKVWEMPGMRAREVFDYTFHFRKDCMKEWSLGADVKGGCYSFRYSRSFRNVSLSDRFGTISPALYLRNRDNEIELILTEVFVTWDNKVCLCLSTMDDRFNRSRSWLRTHDKAVLDAARAKCAEIFDDIAASLDKYLKEGRPIEMVTD